MVKKISRRRMVGRGLKIIGFSTVSGLIIPKKVFGIWGLFEKKKDDTVLLEKGGFVRLMLSDERYTELRNTGGIKKISVQDVKKPIIVLRTSEKEVTAISSECTHHGCEVDVKEGGGFKCPCHGAEYGSKGEVLKGPAENSLDIYEALLDENEVRIDMTNNNR